IGKPTEQLSGGGTAQIGEPSFTRAPSPRIESTAYISSLRICQLYLSSLRPLRLCETLPLRSVPRLPSLHVTEYVKVESPIESRLSFGLHLDPDGLGSLERA